MQPTADRRQYATKPGDVSLYSAGYAEFMRRSNVRRNAAASIAPLLSHAVQPAGVITRILDLGCNDGVMTSLYLSALLQNVSTKEVHLTLVDPATEALGHAAALLARLRARVKTSCVNTTAEAFIPTRDDKYDAIMALWLFYHIQPEVILGLLGMLASQGLLFVSMGSPIHPIKSYGTLAHLSRHGDSLPVETFLVTACSRGLLTFDRLTIPTRIELHGLWEEGRGATEMGNAFFSCYVNLQEKKKTLPLSGTSHRLLDFSLCMDPSMRTPHQRSQASRLNHLLCEVMAVATPHVAYSFRDQEPSCASHFRPCWRCCRHKEGNEVAVVTLFIPE